MRQAWGHLKDKGHQHRHERAAIQWHAELMGFPDVWRSKRSGSSERQAIPRNAGAPAGAGLAAGYPGPDRFVILAVLGFAVIAGVALSS